MTADVYAGDLSMSEGKDRTQERRDFAFYIEADADPDTLLRVASQLNLANCAPSSASLMRRDDETLCIEAQIDSLTWQVADNITRKLSQLTCVREAKYRVASAHGD